MQIILPERMGKRLKEEARKLELTEDELVLRVLSESLKEPLDPKSKASVHLALSDKYLRDAEELIRQKDYIQASEKAWGAASQLIKAIAANRGSELRSHSELHKFAAKLREATKDEEIRRLWQIATSLHQNFYENWLPKRLLRSRLQM